jgi:2-dehydropantoate 2-reductase
MYKCKAFASIDEVEQPDLIVIGVKSYSFSEVLDKIEQRFGNQIPVMSVLNGIEHVHLLSKRFENALFATITYNAYRKAADEAIAAGGTLGLSASKQSSKMLETVHRILKKKVSVSLVENPLDAAHCKLVMNLNNALFTIVGFHDNRNRELSVLQRLSSEIMNEGVDVLQKAGVKEAKIPGLPTWMLIRLGKILPQFIIVPIFKKKTRTSVINSMAQDLKAGSANTELEAINGYFLNMAEQHQVEVPKNKALYQIFKEWSGEDGEPISPSELEHQLNTFSTR